MDEVLLHVLVGPPGAGKSYYAKENFPAEWVVCADDIRERLTRWRRDDPEATWKYVAPVRERIARALGQAVEGRLKRRLPTVYDNTNLLKRNRESLLALVPPGVGVRYLVLDRPLDEKLKTRGWRPAQLIEQQHALLQAELPQILAGDGRPFVTVLDLRMR
jgi:predicted kinase